MSSEGSPVTHTSGGMPSSPAVLPDFSVSIAFMASWSFSVPSSQVFFRCSGMRLIAASLTELLALKSPLKCSD